MDLQSSVAGLHGNPLKGATAASLGHTQSLIIRKEGRFSKLAPRAAVGSRSRNDGRCFVREGAFVASGVNCGNGVVVSAPRNNGCIGVSKIWNYRSNG